MFSREHFAVLTFIQETDFNGTFEAQIVHAGSGLDINNSIDFTQGNFSFTNTNVSSNIMGSLASVFVSPMLYEVFQNTSRNNEELPRLAFVVYDINSPLFQDPDPFKNSTASVIFSFLRSPDQGPAPRNLEEPIKFQFQLNRVSLIMLLNSCKFNSFR